MSLQPVPIPLHERVVFGRDRERYRDPKAPDPREGKCTRSWAEWFTTQATIQAQTPRRMHSKELKDQSAAIVATDMSDGALVAGLYRVEYYATIVQAATTSSSLTVTLDWTDRTVVKTLAGAAITANTTGTVQLGGGLIRVDKNSPVRYSTAYASVGATPMKYDLALTLELVL